MGASWDPKTRGTAAVPRLSRGEWLGGVLVVAVIVGACFVADVLWYWAAGGSS